MTLIAGKKQQNTCGCKAECTRDDDCVPGRRHVHAGVLTFAGLRFGLEDKSFRAGAGVGARSVSAQTVVAEQTVHQTLVDVCEEVRAAGGENGTKMQKFYDSLCGTSKRR